MIFNRGRLITTYSRFADCKIWIANENPLVYAKIIAIMWLWITCVYMMFFFAQVICRNAILAGLIGYGMYSTTAYLGGFFYIIAQSHHIKSLEKAAFILYRSFSHVLVTMPTGNASLGWSFFDLFGFFTPLNDISGYKIYLPEIAIMAGTFVIFFALSRFYYGRMNHPEVEGLFESKLMRAFILYGFGFCLMFPFVFLFVEGMEYAAQMMSVNIIVGMVPAILIHFLLKRRGY
ncbi:MAG: hypothetical protein MJ087_04720 [Lachnospiraceae bacterium]|nr:hypothetical protein [Lachnospiraceae bacterium]